jgi:hypothetical protein
MRVTIGTLGKIRKGIGFALLPAFRPKAGKVAFERTVNVAAHWFAPCERSVFIDVNINEADLERKVFCACVNQNPATNNWQARQIDVLF